MNSLVVEHAPSGLQSEAEVVFSWARAAGATVEGALTLIKCFHREYLQAQPKPKTNYRRGTFTW